MGKDEALCHGADFRVLDHSVCNSDKTSHSVTRPIGTSVIIIPC